MSERLVPVPRRARPWQPNPALLLVSTARAFAAAHWEDVRLDARAQREASLDDLSDEAEGSGTRAFADGGLVRDPDDFQPMQIRPFTQPLSELSRQALQRFNAELSAENPITDAPELQNALLQNASAAAARAYRAEPLFQRAAFVPDIYELDDELDESDLALDAQSDEAQEEGEGDPSDASDALSDEAELLAQAQASEEIAPSESNENSESHDGSEPKAVSADDAPVNELEATAGLEDQAQISDALEAESEADSQARTDEAQALSEDAEPSHADAELNHADTELHAAEIDHTDTTDPEISEAELAHDDIMAPQDLAEAEAEAVEAAVDAAIEEAHPTPTVAGIDLEELARREAEQYELGYAEGERLARDAMAQEIAAQRTVLEGVTQQLHALLQNPAQFFEPLKRLAVHVAEQVVVGELKTSSHAIEQLIQRCLDSLDHPAQGMVLVELHPQDKARLLETAPDLIEGMRIDAVDDMQPGSVRLFANDTIVEDLVANRLRALVKTLHLNEAAWQAQSVLLNGEPEEAEPVHAEPAHADPADPAAAHEPQPDNPSESDDVHP